MKWYHPKHKFNYYLKEDVREVCPCTEYMIVGENKSLYVLYEDCEEYIEILEYQVSHLCGEKMILLDTKQVKRLGLPRTLFVFTPKKGYGHCVILID